MSVLSNLAFDVFKARVSKLHKTVQTSELSIEVLDFFFTVIGIHLDLELPGEFKFGANFFLTIPTAL
jgi:hypothetical protein